MPFFSHKQQNSPSTVTKLESVFEQQVKVNNTVSYVDVFGKYRLHIVSCLIVSQQQHEFMQIKIIEKNIAIGPKNE